MWLIPSVATAGVCFILLLIIILLLLRLEKNGNTNNNSRRRRKEQAPPVVDLPSTTDDADSDLPRFIHVEAPPQVGCYEDDIEMDSHSMDWIPTLSCPKLDQTKQHHTHNRTLSLDATLSRVSSAVSITVTGELNENADDSSIVRDMKKAMAGLRNEPSEDAVEL